MMITKVIIITIINTITKTTKSNVHNNKIIFFNDKKNLDNPNIK